MPIMNSIKREPGRSSYVEISTAQEGPALGP
jgi:hypothetical protein